MLIALNEVEQEALLACSHEAVRLYVLLLRPKMDMATYTVGKVVPISRGGLALDMVYRPPRGSHKAIYQPSVKQVRGLMDELEEAGLLLNQSVCRSRESWQLVFGFPLARASVRVREEGPLKGRPHGQDEGPAQTVGNVGFSGNDGLHEGLLKVSEEGPISGYSELQPLSIDVSSVTGSSTGTREKTETVLDRAVVVAKLLRGAGIDATPTRLRASDMAAALAQPDSDWIAAVERAKSAKQSGRIGVNYLLPIMAQLLDPVFQNRYSGGVDVKGQRFNPAAALREVMHGGCGDEQGRTFDAEV